MQTRTVEQVESWESRPFSGGFESLHELSDETFTGAVVAEGTWLFMLNGRVVGVFEGHIETFDDASGTVYVAPHDSLPLLFSMKERGGSTRAKYFTNDTPMEEADQTLSEANFTGYLELSENVLSGDYYIVYYGGKQMSAAFIGQSERLLTGEEAYERAADEVGIYEVKDVSMNITEIPAQRESQADSGAAVGGAVGNSDVDSSDAEETETTPNAPSRSPEETEESPTAVSDAESPTEKADQAESPAQPGEHEADETTPSPEPESQQVGEAESGTASEETEGDPDSQASKDGRDKGGPPGYPAGDTEEEPGGEEETDMASAEEDEPGARTAREHQGESPTNPRGEASSADSAGEATAEDDSTKDELQRMFEEEEEWRRTNSIPALDPDDTERPDREEDEPTPTQQRSSASRRDQQSREQSASTGGVSKERVEELREAIESRETQIEELSASMERVKEERNEMEQELSELQAERDQLEERVSNLESALQRAKDRQEAVDTKATDLDPEEALAGTNLFVRYESKGEPTLEALSGGEIDVEAVNDNLQLEHHTQFEAEDAQIQGEAFEEFLDKTAPYRFVSWLLREFPYELIDSGKRSALGDLYEAIPRVDRIEFRGGVAVSSEEGAGDLKNFAVVMRDRMGNPLVVAELNDDREPVPDEKMTELIEAAQTVGEVEETLAGAIYVTASFFEPEALEAAEGAASGGGLFSRSDKESYVKTANKSGFHLCLVEDRAESFHVTVPEL